MGTPSPDLVPATGQHYDQRAASPLPARQRSAGSSLLANPRQRNILIGVGSAVLVIILLIVLLPRLLPGPAVTGPSASVTFHDNGNGATGNSDTVLIDSNDLPQPPQGMNYAAWLFDDATEHVTALGMLKQENGAWGLRFNGGGDNLIGEGNKFEITLESQAVPAPQGQMVLMGTFPPQAFAHIQHLLVGWPATPSKQGFLVGLLRQSQILFDAGQSVNVFKQRGLSFSTQCAAQSVLDVLEGKNGQNYQPLSQDCQNIGIVQIGDGYGILGKDGYIEGVIDHATLAARSSDADSHIKLHAQHVEVTMDNVRGWLSQVDDLAVQIHNGDSSKAKQLADLCNLALNGQNLDSDESIDPVPNEAGVIVGYQHGQLLATLKLTKPAGK